MIKRRINIHFSPDSDDLFMFYAIMENKIDRRGYTFNFKTMPIEALNENALSSSECDVIAVSVHNYAYISELFLMLPHGGSVGRNYGPLLISKKPYTLNELEGKKIAIPGTKTTAYLILKMMIPNFEENIVPIMPFERIFDALQNGEVDTGLVIHEGRMIYKERGFHKVADIGNWWYEHTQLPLPLGANIIRKSLGNKTIQDISRIIKDSIRYALDHRDDVITYIMENDPRKIADIKNSDLISRYLDFYANEDTYDYGDDGRKAIQKLLNIGYHKNIIPHSVYVEYAPQ